MARIRFSRTRLSVALAAVAVTAAALVPGAVAAPAGRGSTATPAGVAASCAGPTRPGTAICFALHRTGLPTRKGIQPHAAAPSGYGPTDLRSAYGLPAGAGGGQTVAIVDAYDDPDAEADLAVYRAQYGLLPCTSANGCFQKVDQNGGATYPAAAVDWSQEISLDLDMVSAACPNCHILLVEANSSDLSDLAASVDTAVNLGAKYVSNSYGSQYNSAPGSGESGEDLQFDASYDHPGVAVVASTGDKGYGVAYPAASPHVTAVGGTTLTRDGDSHGWTETAWAGSGSGCSVLEPKPAVQTDTGCPNRAVADVAAVADPNTGVAVYDSYQYQGWDVFGGTSAASPLIASTYALGGTPATGSYPNTYPYEHAGALNDVTAGSTGTCNPAYLCTAAAGYDGPTGLGTPAGLGAFTEGPHGHVVGQVTDTGTGQPIAGAMISDGGATARTGADGHYDLYAPAGPQPIVAQAEGHAELDRTVTVPDGGSVTADFALRSVPSVTLSGTVTDGSGHHWPLYAAISVDGSSSPPVYTDPYTGDYSITLPESNTFTVHVAAMYPGYQTLSSQAVVGTGPTRHDVALDVTSTPCLAPGYSDTSGSCAPVPGGMVAGQVTDTSSGQPLDRVSVHDVDAPADSGTSAATPADPVQPDGFYWLFSSLTGTHAFTAAAARYQSASRSVPVAADAVTRADLALAAGHLTVSSTSITGSVALGGSTRQTLTVHNTGAAPAQLSVGQQTGGLTLPTATTRSQTTVPVRRIKGHYSLLPPTSMPVPGRAPASSTPSPAPSPTGASTGAATGAWLDRADFPMPITLGTMSAYDTDDGRVYTVGNAGTSDALYAYDPAADVWTQLASPPAAVNLSAAGFVDGRLVLAGGLLLGSFDGIPEAAPVTTVQIYDPATNTWTLGPKLPMSRFGSGAAVLDGQLYVVGGCPWDCEPTSSDVYRYDPASSSWQTLAAYPSGESGLACGGVAGEVVCAGGVQGDDLLTGAGEPTSRKTYVYSPRTNTWSAAADLPLDLWGAGYAAADGALVLSGGVTAGSTEVTNQSIAYRPGTNTWSTLPNANHPGFDGSGACGLFTVGTRSTLEQPTQQLPGYTDCTDGTSVPWLHVGPSRVTIPAGGSATIAVTLDGGAAGVNQPGEYTAQLLLTTDTPYPLHPVDVTMTVARPAGWGRLSGTVTGRGCDGTATPLADVTVQVDGRGGSHTISTDAAGNYAVWLDAREDPLTVIASKSGWRIRTATAAVHDGAGTVSDLTLTPQLAC